MSWRRTTLLLVLISGLSYGQQDPGAAPTAEELDEMAKSGAAAGAEILRKNGPDAANGLNQVGGIEVDDTEVPTPTNVSDDKIYLQHLLPGYGTQRSEEYLETLKGAYRTPAEIQRLAEDHNRQMLEGDSAQSEVIKMLDERPQSAPNFQFFTPEDGFHDPSLNLGAQVIGGNGNQSTPLSDQIYQVAVGDCEQVTLPITETERIDLEDIRSCNQVFAPDPDEFSCEAERRFSVSRRATKTVAVITPIITGEQCKNEGAVGAAACAAGKCEQARDLEFGMCKIAQCDGLAGDELNQCETQCAEEADAVEAQCKTDTNPEKACGFVEDATLQACVQDTCGASPSGQCIRQCQTEAASAGDRCLSDCEDAADGAIEQCELDIGIGENGIVDGPFTFEVQTMDWNGVNEVVDGPEGFEFQVETDPFPWSRRPASPEPAGFVSDHEVIVTGGDGRVQSYGSWSDGFTSVFTVNGPAIESIELRATFYRIDENSIEGCDAYLDTVADGFCPGEMICKTPVPSCIRVGGTEICDSGPSAGLMSLIHPWISQAVRWQDWGDIPPLAPRLCSAARSGPMECDSFFTGEGNCYIDANGDERCIKGEKIGLENRIGPEPYLDNCSALIQNESCEFLSRSECAEGGEGPVTGRCYLPDVRFDCGQTVFREKEVATQTTLECGGELQCMGGDCVQIEETENTSQDKMIAAASMVQHMEMDSECMDPGPNGECDPAEVEFFSGEARECKIPIGADLSLTPDCCAEGRNAAEEAGIGFAGYMETLQGAYNASSKPAAAASLASETSRDERQGSHIDTPDWLTLREKTSYKDPGRASGGTAAAPPSRAAPVARSSGSGGGVIDIGETNLENEPTAQPFFQDPEALPPAAEEEANYVSRPFSTTFEGISAQHGYTPDDSESLAQAKGDARNTAGGADATKYAVVIGAGVSTYLKAKFGSALTEKLFSTAGSALFGEAAGAQIANVAKVVSSVWAAYSLTRAIGHIVFQCETSEIELGFERDARRCTYVGKYCSEKINLGFFKICVENREVHCCYNSAFSRILVEQLRFNGGDAINQRSDFGKPKDPYCAGYTGNQIAMAEWDRVDLSEWHEMLNMAEMLPSGIVPTDRRFEQENITPNRPIAGRPQVRSQGPDGMKATATRTAQRISENRSAVEASRDLLGQRGTRQYDEELTEWYFETTNNPSPPRNPDLALGDRVGETPDSIVPGPIEIPDGCTAPGHNLNQALTAGPNSGLPDLNSFIADEAWWTAWFSQPPDFYAAIPFTTPNAPFSRWIFARTGSPAHIRATVSKCPGVVDASEIEPECQFDFTEGLNQQSMMQMRHGTFTSSLACDLAPNETYYLNLNFNFCDSGTCSFSFYWFDRFN